MALNEAWEDTEFGTAEVFKGRPGVFYSHRYDEQGEKDVRDAARDYLTRQLIEPNTRKIALTLLKQHEVDTDWYMSGTQERWIIRADSIAKHALEIANAVFNPEA